MLSLIVLIIFGMGAAFFATQNTGTVHVLLGNFMLSGVPLYIVVIGSILFGVFISWLISLIDSFSTIFTLHGKDVLLKKSQETVEKLQEKNHQLEEEVSRLSKETKSATNRDEEEIQHAPSLFPSLKQRLHLST
ncbi:MAG: DUF1049 domain-containing protein [Patescibacteria group bacterium]|nr:DUF1049 domain-containing protein [Patescibacteria group bacterium]